MPGVKIRGRKWGQASQVHKIGVRQGDVSFVLFI